MPNDHRIPIINHLLDDLHKRLHELENLYSTVKSILFKLFNFSFLIPKVSQSSDKRDLILKQYIEQIFTDLHTRITNYRQQQDLTATVVND
jgi:hypothetical protein